MNQEPTPKKIKTEYDELIDACIENNIDKVKELIKTVDPTTDCNYLLRCASENGHLHIVKFLLAWKGPKNEFIDPSQYCYPTAIDFASGFKHWDVVRELLAWRGPNGEFVNPNSEFDDVCRPGDCLIKRVSSVGHLSVLRELLTWQGPNEEFVDPRICGDSAIRWASANCHLDVVKELFDWRGPNNEFVDISGDFDFKYLFGYVLMSYKDGENVKWRYMNNANIYSIERHMTMLKELFAWRGPNGEYMNLSIPDPVDQVLDCAITSNHLKIVKELLSWRSPNGEYINASIMFTGEVTDYNRSIRLACRYGHLDIVKELLTWKGVNNEFVNPDIPSVYPNDRDYNMVFGRNKYIQTHNYAIRCASENGHLNVVKELLSWRGPNGERVKPTHDNNSGIRSASEKGHVFIVKELFPFVLDSLNNEEKKKYTDQLVCKYEKDALYMIPLFSLPIPTDIVIDFFMEYIPLGYSIQEMKMLDQSIRNL